MESVLSVILLAIVVAIVVVAVNRSKRPPKVAPPLLVTPAVPIVPTGVAPRGAFKETSEKYWAFNRSPSPDGGFFKPYGVGTISSQPSFSPFPEAGGEWEKVGILTQDGATGEGTIMNVFRKPIAPLQDLFQYTVQDRDDFIIRLNSTGLLEDGDKVTDIPSKAGTWTFTDYVKSKWVLF